MIEYDNLGSFFENITYVTYSVSEKKTYSVSKVSGNLNMVLTRDEQQLTLVSHFGVVFSSVQD
jgi:hypothetical protein